MRPARLDEAPPEVEALGDRIADLAARIQAATYELLVLIRQFDERGGWEGFASCAHWLSWRIGLAPGAAREKVRVAHALANLPRLSEAMQRGAVGAVRSSRNVPAARAGGLPRRGRAGHRLGCQPAVAAPRGRRGRRAARGAVDASHCMSRC